MAALGFVPLGGAVGNVLGHWNVLLFFLGLTGTAAVAERSGLFEGLAGLTARLSAGRPRRLMVAVVIVGAVVAAILSNDAAALVLTPVVYVIVTKFGLEPLPYVLACTFVADAASLALPTGNPVNVIVSDRLGESAVGLVPILLPAAVASVVALLACLLVVYRRQLPAHSPLVPAAGAWTSFGELPRPLLAAFSVAVAAFRSGFGGRSAAWADAGGRLGRAARGRARVGRRVWPLDGIGWSLLVFVASMGILVDGLSSAGVTARLAGIVLGP